MSTCIGDGLGIKKKKLDKQATEIRLLLNNKEVLSKKKIKLTESSQLSY